MNKKQKELVFNWLYESIANNVENSPTGVDIALLTNNTIILDFEEIGRIEIKGRAKCKTQKN